MMNFWTIRTPWNGMEATDEFGAGTLDGNRADGPSYDACGPAAIENGAAAYEGRFPSYENIGHIRADMIGHGDWTQPADLHNPRTGGCTLEHIAHEIPRRGYVVRGFHPEQSQTLSAHDLLTALATRCYTVVMVYNAGALQGNEVNVHRHFVGIAAYGGDHADGTPGKIYVLNSDIAGQHGLATGQWMTIAALLEADPRGYVIMAKAAPPPPDIAGAVLDLQQIQQIVDKAVADALAKLQPTTKG